MPLLRRPQRVFPICFQPPNPDDAHRAEPSQPSRFWLQLPARGDQEHGEGAQVAGADGRVSGQDFLDECGTLAGDSEVAMIIKLERVRVQSRKAEEAINITPKVDEIVEESGVKNGVVNVMTCHTSSGLLVTEGIPCLEEDILTHFSRLFPEEEDYHHRRYLDFDGRMGFNAESHLKSVLGGIQCMFP